MSLQEPPAALMDTASEQGRYAEKKLSSRKGFAWAASKLLGRSLKSNAPQGESSLELPRSAIASETVDRSFDPATMPLEMAKAETDLDAVFGEQDDERLQASCSPPQPRFERCSPSAVQHTGFQLQQPRRASDDLSSSIDLDAALGPFNTPQFGNIRSRRDLHSSRGIKDFATPANQNQRHFRTTSAPMLQSFHLGRSNSPSKSDMPVFAEEDEDDSASDVHSGQTQSPPTISDPTASVDDGGLGVHVVETVADSLRVDRMADGGLHLHTGNWQLDRPYTRLAAPNSTLNKATTERRPSAVMEETIVEESSPVEAIDIVSPEEEPRASSLTKSSDSSETPTILAAHTDELPLPDSQALSFITPDAFATSSFASPDLARRQGSFDTSRLGTSTSSIGDARTMSSFATGENSHENRMSVDGVPSLTSSRSTMRSTMHANDSHRELSTVETPAYPLTAGPRHVIPDAEHRHKRTSIASLSQLVGNSFSPKSRNLGPRPQTAIEAGASNRGNKKEHRLKKLMFWKSMNSSKQSLVSNS
nr:uncharacterized protein LOC111994776 [Quercus suber]